MKNCDDVTQELLKRRDDYLAAQKKKKKRIVCFAACLCVLFCAAAVALLPETAVPPDIGGNEQPGEAGGVDGKINVIAPITLQNEAYAFTDREATDYLDGVKGGIVNDLTASGVTVTNLTVKERGYAHVRTGDKGNTLAVNWRDFLAYDGETLVAIVSVTKEADGMRYFLSFGAAWFPRYAALLREYHGQELAYLYIGDVEAFVTPDNRVITPTGTDVSMTLEEPKDYYAYFRTAHNVYTP